MKPHYFLTYFLLVIQPSIGFSVGSATTSSSRAEFVNFLRNGFNTSVRPCDNFYDYVCSNHSSSSDDVQRQYVHDRVIKSMRSDSKYPAVSKALLDYVDECSEFYNNVSYSRQAVVKYLRSFGFLPLLGETTPSQHNFLEALLKLVFLSPAVQINNNSAVASPVSIDYAYLSRSNTIMIYSVARSSFFFNLNDKKFGSFNESFITEWMTYQLSSLDAGRLKRGINLTAEYEETFAFSNDYFSILAESTTKLDVKLNDLQNSHFQSALRNILPRFLDDQVNMAKIKVYVDENLIENLYRLFQRKPRQGQHFISVMALISMTHSIEVRPYGKEGKTKSDHAQSCFYEAINPVKIGAIFNLYVANLMIRNSYPMTTNNQLEAMKTSMEKVKNEISKMLSSTSWSRNDIDIVSKITESIGLPRELFDENKYSAELSRFAGFEENDGIFEKIMKLRASNYRLTERHLTTRDSYFKLVATFHAGLNHLTLPIMFFQPPYYSNLYPDSYIFGFLGSTFGHEVMHRFAPPHNPTNWFSQRAFNRSLTCYKRSYDEMCFTLTVPNDRGTRRTETECVDGENDMRDNIPDVEGARVAYKAMKLQVGAGKLQEKAVDELDNVSNEQMFFIANAKVYCDKKMNDQVQFLKSLRNGEDSHGAEKVRVNAVAMQMTEFASAFHCQPTDAMVLNDNQKCFLFSN